LTDLAGELDQANQEILYLRAALKDAQDSLLAARAGTLPGIGSEQDRAAVKSMIQELHRSTTIIQEYSSYLLGGSLGDTTEVQRKTLFRIQDAAARLNHLALDLAGALSGGMQPLDCSQPALDVSEIAHNAIKALDLELRGKDLNLTLEVADNLPTLWAHPGQIQSLFTALLKAGIDTAYVGGDLLLKINRFSDQDFTQAIECQLYCGQDEQSLPLPEFLQDTGDVPAGTTSGKMSILQGLAVDAGGRAWLAAVGDSDPLITLVLPSVPPKTRVESEAGYEG
jgi:hypothetical protein